MCRGRRDTALRHGQESFYKADYITISETLDNPSVTPFLRRLHGSDDPGSVNVFICH